MIETTKYDNIDQQFEYPDLPSINNSNNTIIADEATENYLRAVQNEYALKAQRDKELWEQQQNVKNNQPNQQYSFTDNNISQIGSSNKQGSQKVKEILDNMIHDPTKKTILLKIAEKESNFKVDAKNTKSSASGLFGFLNSTKQKYGYGNTAEQQIQGASKLYDAHATQLQQYINKYGTRDKSIAQLMYGMWFRPTSLLHYLQTGQDDYKDAQGTSLEKIFAKMAKNGGILKAQDGIIIPKAPNTFRQYGIDPNKFVNMWNGLVNKGISPQVAFDATWQANKEVPKGYYSYGKKKPNLNSWVEAASDSLTTGAYKKARNAQNFDQYRQATFKYNKNPEYTNWLKTNRQDAVNFINRYRQQNRIIGKPIAQLIPVTQIINNV